jgi:hypothetical protein
LEALLGRLGYVQRGGVYRHPGRQAVLVGDLIDRGPDQLRVLEIVRAMVYSGAALVTMGNHEFNAIAWLTCDAHGRPCREHSAKNSSQHGEFLRQVRARSAQHHRWVEWLATLPLWLDLGGLRVVHACWDDASRATLGGSTLTPEMVHAKQGDPLHGAIEVLLKGPELDFPSGVGYLDSDDTAEPGPVSAGGTRTRRPYAGPRRSPPVR